MDYDELLDLTVDLAYQLQQCGAETYRVEETIVRLLGAYGVEGSAFSIPGCIIVSLETAEEKNCRAAPDKATTRIDDNDTPNQSQSER